MSFIERKAELFANIAIIGVAIVLLIVLVNKFWGNSDPSFVRQIPTGETINLEGINWSENGQTLLLVLQENCRYCTESLPFYRKLVEKNRTETKTTLVAVFPTEIEKSQNYLKTQNVEIKDVKQADFVGLGVQGTPTLILVDEQGKVISSWIGKLSIETEEKVLQKVFCKQGANCS